MLKQKILNTVFSIIIVLSLLIGQYGTVSADPPPPKDKPTKITQQQRQAAADGAAAMGFALPVIGEATMAVPGAAPHYFSHPNYANSPLPVVDTATGNITGGIRKFVDGLPGLGPSGANNLGQYISVAVPDTETYFNADYYEIAVVEYQEQLHSDLPMTTLRGYVQLSTSLVPGDHVPLFNPDGSAILMPDGSQAYGVDAPHYLGATIVAQENRPVRIKFYNLLPTGADGNLFIPVDTTLMGAGMAPTGHEWKMANPDLIDPLNPPCNAADKTALVADGTCYPDNRAVIHLHGGISPWISDGTPHQWITPANEDTPYPQGVSVQNVPDMNGCDLATDGCTTLYYTNQQSARLSFYHDHAWGITRLNVYAGEAAGYLITDETEQSLFGPGGMYESLGEGIPLVIQDKTFVPNEAQLATQDETWDIARWGGEGSLWVPHVYSPAQNPGDASGVNQFGRWAYGPWFWPPTSSIEHGPVPNPYYDPACNPDIEWCEPQMMPGTPYNSMGMEAFNDTPTVNGTAYPTITVDPKAYRFRILSVANDRFFNLSFYQAVDERGKICDDKNKNPKPESTGVTCTEVALNPDEVAAALLDPAGVFPTPLSGTEGPAWIQIGSEGGFLPAPTVIPAQPTTWVTDPTVFNAGNVDQHSLLLAPAERADVIVDFSQYAGQTLILYNDAPAAFPARDPRYDYYTGNPDLRDTGGAPSTLPGYGPNTRTVMQIVVNPLPAEPAFDLAPLQAAFTHKPDGSGVFESGQNPIIVGQGAYNSAYGTSFTNFGGLAQIFDFSLTFQTLLGNTLTIPFKNKMIQDEMGEAFGVEYGRMSGFLGVETPNAQAGLQNMILHPYTSPPTEILKGVQVGENADGSLDVTPIATMDDGTQIWKITHNGVDTHPIHFHLYDVQLVNRVGWDGIIRKPDANELGWKDTVRISPLEDTIVALRPIIPHFPFDIPNSNRLIDPSMPEGAYLQNTTAREAAGLPIMAFNPDGEPIDIINHYVNFGWEYVYHCHILSHEEMDMMHAQVIGVSPRDPSDLVAVVNVDGTIADLTWMDNSKNETSYTVERSEDGINWTFVALLESSTEPLAGVTVGYQDTTLDPAVTNYFYRVYASNLVGDTWDYADPAMNEIVSGGFPTLSLDSGFSNTATTGIVTEPDAPANLTATLEAGPQVSLNWTDTLNETSFEIQRSDNGGAFAPLATVGIDTTSYVDTSVLPANSYTYQVVAVNLGGTSLPSNQATVDVFDVPAAPTLLTATVISSTQVDLAWTDNANNEDGYVVQRSTDGGATWSQVGQTAASVAAFSDLTVAPASTYSYQVYAFNITGNSLPSNIAQATTPGVLPAAPTGLVTTNVQPTQVDLAWTDNANNEDGYVVQRSDDGGVTWAQVGLSTAANVTSFSDTIVLPGNSYWYRVYAFNGIGNSANSNEIMVDTPVLLVPLAPSNLSAGKSTGTSIMLSWQDNATNETGYNLEWSLDGATWTVITLPANTSAYTVIGLTLDTTYSFRVQAYNLDGASAYAGPISAKTKKK